MRLAVWSDNTHIKSNMAAECAAQVMLSCVTFAVLVLRVRERRLGRFKLMSFSTTISVKMMFAADAALYDLTMISQITQM